MKQKENVCYKFYITGKIIAQEFLNSLQCWLVLLFCLARQNRKKIIISCSAAIRDCSLLMPKGGLVIFKQFRHMKNLSLSTSGYFKKLPPVYVTGPKCNPPLPPPPPLRTPRASDCEIVYNTCSGRLPMNQNPWQGHLWSYSMEALNKESEFATLHVLFQWPWITLHEHGHRVWPKYIKSDYRITPHAVWPNPGKEKSKRGNWGCWGMQNVYCCWQGYSQLKT